MMNKKLLFGVLLVCHRVLLLYSLCPIIQLKGVITPEHYPETVSQTYFDDSKGANNTVVPLKLQTANGRTDSDFEEFRCKETFFLGNTNHLS